MKKLVLVLVLALIAVPAFAAVTLTESAKSGTTVTVGYDATGEPLPRGFGLVLEATGGTITSVTATRTGESISGSLGYGIFPGTININDVNGHVDSYGTPVEPNALPGGPSALGSGRVVVALGSLYVGDANKPGVTGDLFTVVCSSGTSKLTVSEEDAFRGGVVDVNANPVTVAAIDISFAAPECMKNTASGYPAGPAGQGYINWGLGGKPDCWCYQFQHLGDIDGKDQGSGLSLRRIGSVDLAILAANFGKKRAAINNTAGMCADLDHLDQGSGLSIRAVGSVDLAMLSSNFGKKTAALSSAPYAADYNSWKVAP